MAITVITPPARLAWESLFKPSLSKINPSESPAYGVRLYFTKPATETAEWAALVKSVEQVSLEKFGMSLERLSESPRFHMPIRYDVDGKPDGVFAFLSAKAKEEYPPVAVDKHAQPIMDPEEVYPGAWVRASLRVFAWGGKDIGKRGVSFGLQNVQKLGDGPRLKGARTNGSEFGALPEPDALADMLG